MKNITENEAQTLAFGKKFVKTLKGGEVLALSGDLGAGKTIFSKGVAQGLGVKKIVTSPTFILMNVYNTNHPKIKKFVHIDCYRLENPEELSGIGAMEYFGQDDTLVVVEWAEKIKKILPKNKIAITIKIKDQNRREIILK